MSFSRAIVASALLHVGAVAILAALADERPARNAIEVQLVHLRASDAALGSADDATRGGDPAAGTGARGTHPEGDAIGPASERGTAQRAARGDGARLRRSAGPARDSDAAASGSEKATPAEPPQADTEDSPRTREGSIATSAEAGSSEDAIRVESAAATPDGAGETDAATPDGAGETDAPTRTDRASDAKVHPAAAPDRAAATPSADASHAPTTADRTSDASAHPATPDGASAALSADAADAPTTTERAGDANAHPAPALAGGPHTRALRTTAGGSASITGKSATGGGSGAGPGSGSGSEAGLDAAGGLRARLAWQTDRCYPRAARRRGTEGTVELHFCLDGAGHPERIEVLSSSGSALLDEAATECVVRASAPFDAAHLCITVPVVFELE